MKSPSHFKGGTAALETGTRKSYNVHSIRLWTYRAYHSEIQGKSLQFQLGAGGGQSVFLVSGWKWMAWRGGQPTQHEVDGDGHDTGLFAQDGGQGERVADPLPRGKKAVSLQVPAGAQIIAFKLQGILHYMITYNC